MSQPPEITEALEVLDRELTTPREIARERVAKFQLDREKGEKPLGVANTTTGSGAPLLKVDDVLRRSLPSYGKR